MSRDSFDHGTKSSHQTPKSISVPTSNRDRADVFRQLVDQQPEVSVAFALTAESDLPVTQRRVDEETSVEEHHSPEWSGQEAEPRLTTKKV